MKYLPIFFLLLLTSCHKDFYDYAYKGENNYKNFYIVDTIVIDNPVMFQFTGSTFVTSRQNLNGARIDKKFVERPDVFIVGDNLFYDLPKEDMEKYTYKDEGGCQIIKNTVSKMAMFEFDNKSVKFILAFINVNHYNKNYNNTYRYYQIQIKNSKIGFYKIVYPLCQ